jgi:hypothetical protein
MSIGYKQRGDNGPLYHPERDFAYITPTLMKQAIENMSAPPNPEVEEWKTANEITEAEIIAAAEALADAQHDFVNAADPVDSLHTALHRRKYFTLRLPVRLLLESAIGEVMIGAWFKAVREVTQLGEESPAQNEMCRFSSAVREFAAAQGAPVISPVSTAEVLLAQNSVLRARFNALRDECLSLQKQLRESGQLLQIKCQEIEVRKRPWWKRLWDSAGTTDYPGPK